MTFEEFDHTVNEAVGNIPAEFKQVLEVEGIEIIAREVVPENIREKFSGSIVFGLFVGVSRNLRNSFSMQTEPTRIEIYKESFERVYGLQVNDTFKAQIIRTVIHEIAHYFGFNEEEIAARGY